MCAQGAPLMAVAGRPTTLETRPQRQREAGGIQVRSPAPPRDHALGGRVHSCTDRGSGMLASWGVRGSSARCFSASVRPRSPDKYLLTPSPFAQYGLLLWRSGALGPAQISYFRAG